MFFLFGTKRISVNILNAKVIVALNLVIQLNDTPDTSAEQAVKFLRVFVGNRYIANAQIGKLRKKAVLFHIQSDSHHINDSVTAFLSQLRQNLLRFIRAYKIISKNTLHVLYAFFNDRFII